MSDDKIRCLLAYRLPRIKGYGGHSTVLLAKYDYASQYETHSGASGDASTLYGGRDKKYAKAVEYVIENNPPGKISKDNKLGGFKNVHSDIHQVIYGVDREGICLAVITGLQYQSHIAITMLVELYDQFEEIFGLQIKAATTDSLSKKAKPLFHSICQKYDDPSTVDKTSELIAKVEEVKSIMSDNIRNDLKIIESAEALLDQSKELENEARKFKTWTIDLKKKMRWKKMKMNLILASVILLLIIIIVVPIVLKVKNAKKAT